MASLSEHETVWFWTPRDSMYDLALLDTNILLLILVAWTDASLLTRFKRVSAFRQEDADLLSDLLTRFRGVVTTPPVLTEVSNFVDQSPAYARDELLVTFKRFVALAREEYVTSQTLITREEFYLLGLTDTALSEASKAATVITADYRLAGKIQSLGGRCINFNQLRAAGLP